MSPWCRVQRIVLVVVLICISGTLSQYNETKIHTFGLRKLKQDPRDLGKSLRVAPHYLRDREQVTLQDFQDVYYCGEMTIGTLPQKFLILFDTGSADLWVPSLKFCSSNPSFCSTHETYDHDSSVTYVPVVPRTTFSITYGTGSTSGYVSEDTVRVEGLSVTNQKFGESTVISRVFFSCEFDGVFGLAYPELSNINTDPPFVTMMKRGLLDQPVFAFYLNRASDLSNDGELVLGGINPKHYTGEIHYTPVISKTYWLIQMDGMFVGTTPVSSSYPAMPDSGTTLILGPTAVMDAINNAIGGTYDSSSGLYLIDCGSLEILPQVTFVINGTSYPLFSSDYILMIEERNQVVCISGFAGFPKVPYFILGNVFMRKYYTVFDMGRDRVGFALAVHSKPYPQPPSGGNSSSVSSGSISSAGISAALVSVLHWWLAVTANGQF